MTLKVALKGQNLSLLKVGQVRLVMRLEKTLFDLGKEFND